MGRGKYLSAEKRVEIVELYQEGCTGPEICKIIGVSPSTIVKVLRNALGPSNTASRPRRRPSTPKIYDGATQRRMAELYKQGHSLVSAAREIGCDPATVAKAVKDCGGSLRHVLGAPRTVTPLYYCVVCNDLIKAHACYHNPKKGVVIPARTCGKPECQAALAFGAVEPIEPVCRRDVRVSGGFTPRAREGYRQRQKLEGLFLVERLPKDLEVLARVLPIAQYGQYEARFELVKDLRGSRRPGVQASIWGELSRVPVYVRLVARGGGHSAIRLVLWGNETVFDRFVDKFFADKEQLFAVSKAFNPLIVWRCACPTQSTWQLGTVLELPEKNGLYGLCPACGSCALNVRHEEQ